MITDNKPWLSGEPYYCDDCGGSYFERAPCDDGVCSLESKDAAMRRRYEAGKPKNDQHTDKLMSREEIEEARNHLFGMLGGNDVWALMIKELCDTALHAAAGDDIYDKAIEDAAQVIEDEDCCSTISDLADHVRNLKGTSNS